MNKQTGFLPLLLAALFCFTLLAGCSTSADDGEVSDSSGSESPGVSDDAGGEAAEDGQADGEDSSGQEDLIGTVTEVGEDGTLTLSVCQADGEITDYTLLDGVTLTDTGETVTVTPEEDAVYERVADGVRETAAWEDLAAGDVIAVTTGENDVQTILILDYTAGGDPAGDGSDTAPDSDTDGAGETGGAATSDSAAA